MIGWLRCWWYKRHVEMAIGATHSYVSIMCIRCGRIRKRHV